MPTTSKDRRIAATFQCGRDPDQDQIVDWLLQQAQVTETPSTFAAVMAPPKPAVADAESATGEQESSA